MRIRLLTPGVLLLAVAVTGCSSDRAKVSGKVYVGDKLVTAGHVQFHGPNKAFAAATIQGDGSYEVPDAPVGACKITVQPAPRMPTMGAPPKGVPPIDQGDTPGGKPAASARVPDKYQKADSTDLNFTIAPGSNSHDVRMQP